MRGGPADKGIAGMDFPRGGGKTEQGQRLVVAHGEVPELGTGERLIAEVVVPIDILVPQMRCSC